MYKEAELIGTNQKDTILNTNTINESLRYIVAEIFDENDKLVAQGYDILDAEMEDYLTNPEWEAFEAKLTDEYFSAERRVRERRDDLGDLEVNEIAWDGVKADFKERLAADIKRHMTA